MSLAGCDSGAASAGLMALSVSPFIGGDGGGGGGAALGSSGCCTSLNVPWDPRNYLQIFSTVLIWQQATLAWPDMSWSTFRFLSIRPASFEIDSFKVPAMMNSDVALLLLSVVE